MAEPTSEHERNGEPRNAACEHRKPQETPQGASLTDVSKTLRDVRILWGSAVSPNASCGSSIKAGGIAAGLESASKLLPRLRRLSKAKEDKEKPEESDFELIELLGKGGMGMVFLARQKSLDREVAVKVIQPQAAEDAEARGKFFAEALVTGELDHPNIVPVYDFGGTPEGVLFYPMKQVRGTSWDKVIQQKSLEENLSILNSVCDAVAFAHDKGVIHRDLKPGNVMLGDYGEVFVMDWGLAASVGMEKAEKLTPETGFAGTPAYMAPEMAKCEPTKIGPASDIYLLGGILYEIVTGLRPHSGDDVYSCIHAAMENVIQPVEKKGELAEIALKAMATEPGNRHNSVKDFQLAIREYRSHAESLKLSAAADQRLSRVKEKPKAEVYRELTEVIAGHQQAIELWSQNESAILGLRKARETFVEVALERGDLTLAQSHLSAMEEECEKFVLPERRLESPKDLAEKVGLAIAQAARREKAARLSRRAALAAASLVLIVSLTAYFITRAARDRERTQKNRAVAAQRRALAAKAEEAKQRQKTEGALKKATEAKEEADRERKRAQEALQTIEKQTYCAAIASAAEMVEDLQMSRAEALLWKTAEHLRGWEWGRLMLACRQELATIKSDEGGVRSVAFSPDAKSVLTTSGRKVSLWDAASAQKLLTLERHLTPVVWAAFSADGTRVMTGTEDRTVKVWDREAGRRLFCWRNRALSSKSVDFSPNGDLIVTASQGGTASIWDAKKGREILKLTGHTASVGSVAFSPDGKHVATGSQDGTARIWSLEGAEVFSVPKPVTLPPSPGNIPGNTSEQAFSSLKPLKLEGHVGWVTCVAYSPDGKHVATASQDGTAKVWDAETGQEILTLKGHSSGVESVAFSPDGNRIVTGSDDKTAKVWNAEHGEEILTLSGHSDYVNCVAFSPDGKQVATGSEDGTTRLWSAEDGEEILTLKGHGDYVNCVAFCSDGKRIITGGEYSDTSSWVSTDVQSSFVALPGRPGKPRTVDPYRDPSRDEITQGRTEGSVTSIALSRDGRRMATLRSFDEGADISSVEGWPLLHLGGSSSHSFSVVAFSPEGRRVGRQEPGMIGKVWTANGGQEILTLGRHPVPIRSMAFSLHGDRVATGDLSGRVRVWDIESGRQIAEWSGHSDKVDSVSFSPDGKRIATGSDDKTARLWNVGDAKEVLTLGGHLDRVNSVAFSPDGKRIITGSADKTAKVWITEDGKEILTLRGHSESVDSVAFSPDGREVVTGSGDGTVRIWDATQDPMMLILRGHRGKLLCASFSRDGNCVVTASQDGTARVWDAKNGRALLTLSGYIETVDPVALNVDGVAFSPNGKHVAMALASQYGVVGIARVWEVESGQMILTLKGHEGCLSSVAFSPDGKHIVTGSDDGTARVWRAEDGKEILTLRAHVDVVVSGFRRAGFVHSAAFSPSGKIIATASQDKTTRIWDAENGEELLRLQGHTASVGSVAFSPDGKRVVTASQDRTARIWNIEGVEVLSTPERFVFEGFPDGLPKGAVVSAAISPWELLKLEGHSGWVTCAAYSPDGKRVATASQDGTAKVWDAETGQEILTLKGHSSGVESVAFSPDARRIITASLDGTARIWNAFDWRLSRERLEEECRERYRRWLSGNSNGSDMASRVAAPPKGSVIPE